jgi:hypothetical protein
VHETTALETQGHKAVAEPVLTPST